MTEAATDGDERFDPSRDPATAATSAENEPLNVCRAAALSSMLAPQVNPLIGVQTELYALGFNERLADEGVSRRYDLADVTGTLMQRRTTRTDESRVVAWELLNESLDPVDVYDFLTQLLRSPLERESAAAAAAIWRDLSERGNFVYASPWPPYRTSDPLLASPPLWEPAPSVRALAWDGDSWAEYVAELLDSADPRDFAARLMTAAAARLRGAQASADNVTRSLAQSTFLLASEDYDDVTADPAGDSDHDPGISTMIHGTNAWQGDWWRPGPGRFHDFVLQNVREDLYQGGARFSWNGYLRDEHRTLAAQDFCDWAGEVAPQGLHTVFAHSYGGEVAAKAAVSGLGMTELVLLSAPVNGWVRKAAEITPHVVDVRLPFDPILAAARLFQRLEQWLPVATNTSHVVLSWRLSHSASHDPAVWAAEDVAARGGL